MRSSQLGWKGMGRSQAGAVTPRCQRGHHALTRTHLPLRGRGNGSMTAPECPTGENIGTGGPWDRQEGRRGSGSSRQAGSHHEQGLFSLIYFCLKYRSVTDQSQLTSWGYPSTFSRSSAGRWMPSGNGCFSQEWVLAIPRAFSSCFSLPVHPASLPFASSLQQGTKVRESHSLPSFSPCHPTSRGCWDTWGARSQGRDIFPICFRSCFPGSPALGREILSATPSPSSFAQRCPNTQRTLSQ